MDTVQIILIIVVVSLTTLLVFVGIQVILIIKDLRKAVKKLNSILEDSMWGGGLLRPDKLLGIVEMFREKKHLKKRERENVAKEDKKGD